MFFSSSFPFSFHPSRGINTSCHQQAGTPARLWNHCSAPAKVIWEKQTNKTLPAYQCCQQTIINVSHVNITSSSLSPFLSFSFSFTHLLHIFNIRIVTFEEKTVIYYMWPHQQDRQLSRLKILTLLLHLKIIKKFLVNLLPVISEK